MRDPIYRLDEIRVEKANAQLQQEKRIEQLEQELKEAKDDLKTAEDTINELTIQIIGGE